MGARGPLPKDSHLRAVDNDWRESKPTPKPASAQCPKMPTGLPDAAQAEWRRVAKRLWQMGLLTELDRLTLAIYCQLVARYDRYNSILDAEGDTFITDGGMIRARPEVAMRDNALKEIRMFIKEFGFSPNARARMTLPEPQQNELDEFEALLDD